MPRKTRSDKGTERPLTMQEKAIKRGLKELSIAGRHFMQADAAFTLADSFSPTTDNRRRVAKRARKGARK